MSALPWDGITDPERCHTFIDADDQALRSDYVRTLETWSSCFPKEQIYIGFYDDVVRDPQLAITKIFDFLGVDSQCSVSDDAVTDRVFASDEVTMPEETKVYLAKKYYPQLQKLTALVGGHALVWLTQAEKILSMGDYFV